MKKSIKLWLFSLLATLILVPTAYATELYQDLVAPVIYAPALHVKPNQPVDLLADVMVADDVSTNNRLEIIDYPESGIATFTEAQRGIQYVEYHAYDDSGNLAILYRPIMVGYMASAVQNDLMSPEFVTTPLYIGAGTTTFAEIAANKKNIGVIDYTDGDLIDQVTLDQDSIQVHDLSQPGVFRIKWRVEDQHKNPAVAYQWVVVYNSATTDY